MSRRSGRARVSFLCNAAISAGFSADTLPQTHILTGLPSSHAKDASHGHGFLQPTNRELLAVLRRPCLGDKSSTKVYLCSCRRYRPGLCKIGQNGGRLSRGSLLADPATDSELLRL